MKVLRRVGMSLEAPSIERVSRLLKGLLKQKQILKNRWGEQVAKEFRSFSFGQTWFKLEAEWKSSIFIGFLTPQYVPILLHHPVPCYLSFGCGVTSLCQVVWLWAQAEQTQ